MRLLIEIIMEYANSDSQRFHPVFMDNLRRAWEFQEEGPADRCLQLLMTGYSPRRTRVEIRVVIGEQ